MRYIDIKTEPRTRFEAWMRWLNWMQTRCVLMVGKRIEVKNGR